MRHLRLFLLVGILLAICGLQTAFAVSTDAPIPTPQWIFFYSRSLRIGDALATPGSIVQAFVSRTNQECGAQSIGGGSELPLLTCYMADPTSGVDGARNGDVIYFKVDGVQAIETFTLPATIQNGDRFEILRLSSSGPTPIPEPITITLFGLGVAGMAGYMRLHRRRHQNKMN